MKKCMFFAVLLASSLVYGNKVAAPRIEGHTEIYDVAAAGGAHQTIPSASSNQNILTIKNKTNKKAYARVADRTNYRCKKASGFICNCPGTSSGVMMQNNASQN